MGVFVVFWLIPVQIFIFFEDSFSLNSDVGTARPFYKHVIQ